MNSDDNTPALGIPTIPRTITREETLPAVPGDDIDPELGVSVEDLNVFDAFWHEVGMLACEDPRPSTPEEKERAEQTYRSLVEMMSKPPEEVRAERERRRARGK